MSKIKEKFEALGGEQTFGPPTGGESSLFQSLGGLSASVGYGRHYEKGSIYSHEKLGCYAVFGRIRHKWRALGAEKGVLGFPTSDEAPTACGRGVQTTFENGTIFHRSGAAEAFVVGGWILEKYEQLGGSGTFLGFPTADDAAMPDGEGQFGHFDGGSIYWKPSVGAHLVHGPIREAWLRHGWQADPPLGYPIADVRFAGEGSADQFSDFENGVVLWLVGAAEATILPRFSGASRPAAHVQGAIADWIRTAIERLTVAGADGTAITDGPHVGADAAGGAPVTDYSFAGGRAVSRRHRVRVGFNIVIARAPDVPVELDLDVELVLSGQAVWARIERWWAETDVPRLTSLKVSIEEMNRRLQAALETIEPFLVEALPPDIEPLCAKTMPNGDFHTYVKPTLQALASAAKALPAVALALI